MLDLGWVRPGSTVFVPFHTFDSNDPSASVTITGLAATDIEIYKDGSMTQRASDSGYTLLDTDGIDLDGTTGIHGVSIDLADNDTAGYFAAGSQYWVVIASITVDGATINFIPVTFRIGYDSAIVNTTIATLSTQVSFTLTKGSAEADAYNGWMAIIHDVASEVQIALGYVSDYAVTTKTVTLAVDPAIFTMAAGDNISLFPPAQVASWNSVPLATTNPLPNAAAQATGGLYTRGTGVGQINTNAAGQVDVNTVSISGDTPAADALETMLDGTGGNVLTLKQLNIVNNSGSAIIASSTGSDGHGIHASAHGTGVGLLAQGGATNGQGAHFQAQGSGEGLRVEATGAGGAGMSCFGNTSGPGFQARGGTTAHGIVGQGGITGTQNNGIYGVGGTNVGDIGSGIKGDGAESGAGIGGNGGPSAGAGIRATAQDSGSPAVQLVAGSASHGLQIIAGSASGTGVIITGGATAGVGLQILGTGGSNAIELTGDMTGDIVGNLSGSVGSVTVGVELAATAVDDIWDEVLIGATHNVANSSGRRLRQIQEAGNYQGAVWIDTVNGVAGTTNFENGVDTNPVDNIADANTIAASLGLSRFMVAPGSSITLAVTQADQVFQGDSWTLALGGQNIDGSTFLGADVTGIATNTAGMQFFVRCMMGAVTLPKDTHVLDSGIDGTQTLGSAGDIFYDNCHSALAGSDTHTFDFGAGLAASQLNFRHFSGGIEIQNMGAGAGSYTMSLEGHGQLVINANCSATSTIAIRGHFIVTDNAGGAVTLDEDARIDVGQITASVPTAVVNAAAVWDEARAGHVAAGSFGEGVIVETNSDKTGYAIAVGGIAATSFAAGAIDAAAIATDFTDEIWAKICEDQGSRTAQEILSILLSACAGVTAGSTFSTPNGVSTRITATLNASEERTAITLAPSAGA